MVNGGYKQAQALDAVHESAYAHPGFFATFVVKCVNTTGTLNIKVVIMTGGYLSNVSTVLYAVLWKNYIHPMFLYIVEKHLAAIT